MDEWKLSDHQMSKIKIISKRMDAWMHKWIHNKLNIRFQKV